MINKVINKILILLNQDNERSKKILSNVILSFFVKAGSMIVGLLLVPITINYINSTDYGIWLTVSSIVSWLAFFDIGLGNGLRNKLAESIALGNYNVAQKYVSNTYFIISFIALLIALFFSLINKSINWQHLLNIHSQSNSSLQTIMLMTIWSFCIIFVLRIINSILNAVHKTALSGVISFLGQLGVLVCVIVLKKVAKPDLLTLTLILNIVPILISLISTIYLFSTQLKNIAPHFFDIDKTHLKDILNLGLTFFIIQIGALVLFQTDNFVISRINGPEAVTEFGISFKLFSIISMLGFIILTPYWSAYTDAWARKDFDWMKKNLILIRKIWLLFSLMAVFLYFISPLIYHIWIGNAVKISRSVSFANMIYTIVITFQASHNYIINGIGKIKLQVYLMIAAAILNLPLCFFLGKLLGTPGVIYSNVLFMLVLGITFYFETNKLILKSSL